MRSFNFAQLGARYRYQYAALLNTAGLLEQLYTDFWMPVKMDSTRVPPLVSKMAGRRNDLIGNSKVTAFYGLGFQLFKELRKSNDIFYQSEILATYGSKFALQQLKYINRSSGYIGMCSESLEVLDALKETDSPTILIQYDACDDSAILVHENERWPDWTPEGNHRSPAYYGRVYKEWDSAGQIMVNSEWTRDQIVLQGADPSKIFVVPLVYSNPGDGSTGREVNLHKPLRVLYAGSVVLRKGVQYLLEAARLLKPDQFEFYILGQNYQRPDAFQGLGENVRFIGQLPYQELGNYYKNCDVLVFPSLSDGFGSVQVEAMGYGLPVIASTSCASVVEHGKSGFLVPPGDSISIGMYLQRLADDRSMLESLSCNALNRAKEYSIETISGLFLNHLPRVSE
jgi:glycosyltransferase involved in cell wall biosynthesis